MATAILFIVAVYLAVGVAFALWFVFVGVKRIDETAARGTLGFRLLIVPGCAAFWPVMLRKVVHRANAHGLPTVGNPPSRDGGRWGGAS